MLTGVLLDRRIWAGVLVASLVVGQAVPAHADDSIGSVDCGSNPNSPGCDLTARTPGRPGANSERPPSTTSGDSGGSDSAGSDSDCTYDPADSQAPPPAGTADGTWYSQVCPSTDSEPGSVTLRAWLRAVPAPTPAELARQASARLALPALVISLNPAPPRAQLVALPTWVWVNPGSWHPRSATASVPNLSITATATPVALVVSPGDGSLVTCRGPGTAWAFDRDPNTASPTCGHTYTKPGRFTLTATATWTVTWAGGGQNGNVPDLVTTTTQMVTVVEAQALN